MTYAIAGPDIAEMEQWFIDNVLHPLAELAGDDATLWWRLPTGFQVSLRSDGRYTLRTRLVVLNNQLVPVQLDDVLKREGDPVQVVAIGEAACE